MKKGSGTKEELRNALQSVEKALGAIELEVKSGSCTDLARLIQMRKELTAELEKDSIKEIRVTWVEPDLESVTER
jgi:hypothetical protein